MCILIYETLIKKCVYFLNSTKSYGSHEHDPYDSESHRGSKRSLHNAEEKKDPSKEDVETNQNGM